MEDDEVSYDVVSAASSVIVLMQLQKLLLLNRSSSPCSLRLDININAIMTSRTRHPVRCLRAKLAAEAKQWQLSFHLQPLAWRANSG